MQVAQGHAEPSHTLDVVVDAQSRFWVYTECLQKPAIVPISRYSEILLSIYLFG